jgi:hypothetical protein
MTWPDALDALADRPHVARYRELCADENPDVETRDAWRAKVVRLAAGDVAPRLPGVFATLRTAGSTMLTAGGAVGRVVGAIVRHEPVLASDAEQDRRMAICRACDRFETTVAGPRCRACSCFLNLKTRLETETGECPLQKW